MPTECIADLFGFGSVEGREVVAAFDGGMITSDAGALLLGATDRAMGMTARFASCFSDTRRQEYIEHEVVTLVTVRGNVGAAPRSHWPRVISDSRAS
jgi:Transposase DDE domain group 1